MAPQLMSSFQVQGVRMGLSTQPNSRKIRFHIEYNNDIHTHIKIKGNLSQ